MTNLIALRCKVDRAVILKAQIKTLQAELEGITTELKATGLPEIMGSNSIAIIGSFDRTTVNMEAVREVLDLSSFETTSSVTRIDFKKIA